VLVTWRVQPRRLALPQFRKHRHQFGDLLGFFYDLRRFLMLPGTDLVAIPFSYLVVFFGRIRTSFLYFVHTPPKVPLKERLVDAFLALAQALRSRVEKRRGVQALQHL
jgi:hypothetical protein